MKKGVNELELTTPSTAGDIKILDAAIEIRHPRGRGELDTDRAEIDRKERGLIQVTLVGDRLNAFSSFPQKRSSIVVLLAP